MEQFADFGRFSPAARICYNWNRMKRRSFMAVAAAGLAGTAIAEEAGKGQYFALCYYYMGTGPQVDRTTQYLSGAYLPAARRAGVKISGFFSPVIGDHSPFILSLAVHSSVAAMETAAEHQNRVTELSSVEQPNHKCLLVILARVSIVSTSGS